MHTYAHVHSNDGTVIIMTIIILFPSVVSDDGHYKGTSSSYYTYRIRKRRYFCLAIGLISIRRWCALINVIIINIIVTIIVGISSTYLPIYLYLDENWCSEALCSIVRKGILFKVKTDIIYTVQSLSRSLSYNIIV